MAWEFHVLVVANVTATSDELLAALRERAGRGACSLHPADARASGRAGREAARLGARRWRRCARPGSSTSAGRSATPTRSSPTMEIWDPMQFDEIVVSTLPDRLVALARARPAAPAREADLRAGPPRGLPAAAREVHWERPPEHEQYGVLSPLAAALTASATSPSRRLGRR